MKIGHLTNRPSMFRYPVPTQQAQYKAVFEHILGGPPPEELLDAIFTLIRSQSYREYRLNLFRAIALCRDLVANVADREFLWYGPWDTVMDFWFRSLGLHIIPQYPLWILGDGGSHSKLDDQRKQSVGTWSEKVLAEVQATPATQSHNVPFLSTLSDTMAAEDSFESLDFSIDDIPPVEVSKERSADMRLADEASLGLDRLHGEIS